MNVDLSIYSTKGFARGASKLKEAFWLIIKSFFFTTPLPWPSKLRVFWLRLLGAKIGCGVVIRSQVNITFPWKLEIGNHVWIGEECWLLNLEKISVGDHVCLSQRSFLCTGNHNYKSTTFDLIVEPILIENGVWIGAGAFVGPGVVVGNHAVLVAGSVTGKKLEPYGVYQGNPAQFIRQRVIGIQ